MGEDSNDLVFMNITVITSYLMDYDTPSMIQFCKHATFSVSIKVVFSNNCNTRS